MTGGYAPEATFERRTQGGGLTRVSSEALLGKSYVLLAASDGYAWCEAAETIRAQLGGVSLDVYRVGSKELRDPTGNFNVQYGIGIDGAVLVKPDRTIAWRATSMAGDPHAALADAFSQIAGMKSVAQQDAQGMVRSSRPAVTVVPPPSTPSPAPQPAPAAKVAPPPPPQGSNGGFHNPFAMPVPSLDGITLYVHPISMFSRPIRLFVAESGLKIREQIVDLAKGEHHGPDYTKKNPSQLVPMLEEGDFRLTESAAILKYLADRANSAAYPSDPMRRAKIDEMIDWLNTQFYRDWGHNLCLPQLFPNHRRRSDEAHAGAIEWGKENSRRWLQVLNDGFIGKNQYLVGDRITIADYFGAALVTLGEVLHTDFGKYPNVDRWLNNMKRLRHWAPVNDAFNGFVGSTKGKPFETV